MTKKKNRFLTFCFSLLPGAGEMYLGFMKQGVSLMGMFFGMISLTSFLDFSPLIYITPIIWFYSFFNTNNLASLSDEEFYAVEDRYLLFSHLPLKDRQWLKEHKKILAYILIFFGASIVWKIFCQMVSGFLGFFLPSVIPDLMYTLSHTLPQLIVAAAIIYLGVSMIREKKEKLKLLEEKQQD